MLTGKEIHQIILNETVTLLPHDDLKIAFTDYYSKEDEDYEEMHTSEKLKKVFKKIIFNQPLFKSVQKSIQKLIDNDLIIPVLASKSILGMIKRRIFAPPERTHTLGYYSSNRKKIFIILENNTSFIFFSKDEEIALVVMHELQHFCYDVFPKEFLNVHKESLVKFYQTFISLTFQVHLTDEDAFDLVKWVSSNVAGAGIKNLAVLVRYALYLEKLFLKYVKKDDNAIKRISPFLSVLKLYLSDLTSFVKALQNGNKNVVTVFINLNKSYESLGIKKVESLCIQELWAPSEIICIESQYNTSQKHFKLLSKLETLK